MKEAERFVNIIMKILTYKYRKWDDIKETYTQTLALISFIHVSSRVRFSPFAVWTAHYNH